MNEVFLSQAKTLYGESFKDLEQTISQTLNTLGIYPSKKGYGILKDAVIYSLVIYKTTYKTDIIGNDGLYETMSEWNNCSKKTVESNIRHTLKSAHNCGKLRHLNDIIGIEVLDDGYPISNLQFISLIAQHCYYKF